MKRITSAEVVRHFSRHTDAALIEPVVITRNRRDRLVMLSVDAYRELLRMAATEDSATGKPAKRLQDLLQKESAVESWT